MTPSRRIWFVWQSSPIGPAPAVYYDDPPGKGSTGGGLKILAVHELSAEQAAFVNEHDVPFGALSTIYPPPREAE